MTPPLSATWLARLLVVTALVGLTGAACLRLAGPDGVARQPVAANAAFVAEDGQVHVVALAGGDARQVSQVARPAANQPLGRSPEATPGQPPAGREVLTARWPTWAPDGSRLAFLRVLVDPTDTLTVAQVWTVAPDGADPRLIWESPDRQPIYLTWSPSSGLMALLVESEDTLELVLVDPAGIEPPRQIVRGSPLYFVWSSDSRSLLVHLGDDRPGSAKPDLALVRLGPPDEWRSFGIVPGDFRTPGWSADGKRIAYVAVESDGVGMVSLVSPHGGDVTRLATVSRQTALALSADGTRLAWGTRSEADRLLYDGLEVVTADGRSRVRVTDDLVMAFYWSPDDRHLAFITLDRVSRGFAWNLADADGRQARRLGTFRPSEEQLRQLAFFDQYAISHGLWSPDGRSLVYAVGADDDRRAFGAPSPGWVYTLPADGSAPARLLANGSFVALPVAPAGPVIPIRLCHVVNAEVRATP